MGKGDKVYSSVIIELQAEGPRKARNRQFLVRGAPKRPKI